MSTFDYILEKYRLTIYLQVVLLLIAAFSYGVTIFQYPLVDYDEATYAKVVVDTLKSGDISSFTLSGQNWFEKPPLYLWLAMGSIAIFGEQEFAFRLPSVAASIVCLWLVYLLIIELTSSSTSAALAFLILLYSNTFFYFTREARLDSGVIMTILAALLFLIKGWKEDRYLFWIFPAIAVGILSKSVIGLLAGPILMIYSLFYGQWSWLRSKHLWWGFLASLVIVIPWHLLESIRFGWSFWDDYFGRQVFSRATSILTGSNDNMDFIRIFYPYYIPWIWVLFAQGIIFSGLALSNKWRRTVPWGQLLAPLATATFLVSLFTLAKTHLAPYILPVFPFLALSIALAHHYLAPLLKRYAIVLTIVLFGLVIVGTKVSFDAVHEKILPYYFEMRTMGETYKKDRGGLLVPLYVLDWTALESLNYYGDTRTQYMNPRTDGGRILKAPFYLITNTGIESYLVYDNGTFINKDLRALYQSATFVLIYSDKDFQLPAFRYAN